MPNWKDWGRFWTRVDAGEGDGCWEWTGGKVHTGYGRFYADGYADYAHRIAWKLTRGEIPEGMCICHRCDNPGCVTPDHLFLGTPADNAADRDAKGQGRNMVGEQNPGAKLTEADVLEIRRLWAETDLDQREIAEMFGISPTQAARIIHREQWGYLGVK